MSNACMRGEKPTRALKKWRRENRTSEQQQQQYVTQADTSNLMNNEKYTVQTGYERQTVLTFYLNSKHGVHHPDRRTRLSNRRL
jgi:hypothetical protein